MSAPRDLQQLRRRVQSEIETELAHQRGVLAELGEEGVALLDVITTLLSGGKRLRAAFCYWGYRGLGGTHDDAAARAATAMEFFQAAALLHDDVMDDSAVRRGAPTALVHFSYRHEALGWLGRPSRFGQAAAILAGDLCLVWTDEVMATCGLPVGELARARRCFDDMRTQLMAGQFLDILHSARGWDEFDHAARVETARRIVRYKSAKYSVEQPLLIGADAAGVDAADRVRLSAYGLELGEAFQLRDDVLGVYGDPDQTGKPAGDDLREGKYTVLIALTLARCSPADAQRLTQRLGRADLCPADIDAMRTIITDSGALDALEEMITAGTRAAQAELAKVAGLSQEGHEALGELTLLTTSRTT
ncbi:MAG: polyprenyl synthetase family protein [Micrococcales bacterium]|nr:polyprenyl synthetase family protein [Micrococcales bacterium]